MDHEDAMAEVASRSVQDADVTVELCALRRGHRAARGRIDFAVLFRCTKDEERALFRRQRRIQSLEPGVATQRHVAGTAIAPALIYVTCASATPPLSATGEKGTA